MTMQLRPTFSESWYRVKNLKAKLRASAQISRQYYRGERWYVVRDPAGNQYHRLSDPAYRFVGLLNGHRTVGEAWDLAGGHLADDAPTQPEVIQILSHLYSANLIDADVTPDAAVLLRRHKKQQQRKMQGRLMNILFPRIPLWDPDRFLKLWMPIVRQGFSKIGAIIWLLVVGFAIYLLAPEWESVKRAAANSINPSNWLWLWAVFVVIKLIHELGHAFGCRRFGGECHELGIMFLVFIPTPYVDASSAWSFPNKWHRIFVGAAGMIVELFVAAVLTIIWLQMNHETLWAQLMFNAMLVASVSTVVFNANPLLRYDGYYILSDWLEIPNLRQKSSEYTLGLIKRHVFRVKQTQPLPPVGQRVWLFFYAIASSIYRVIVGFAIMLLVYFQIPVLGVLMAVGGVMTWLLVPVYKTTKYLLLDPELHRKRPRAVAFSVAVAAAVVVLLGLVRFPVNIDEVGVIEPANKFVVRGMSSGFITRLGRHPDGRPLKDGDFVKKGQILWVAEDKTLDTQIEGYRAEVEGTRLQLRGAQDDPLAQQVLAEKLARWENLLAQAEDRRRELTVIAPLDGQLIAPNLNEMPGRHLREGQEAAVVADMSELEVVTLVEQRDSAQVIDYVSRGGKSFKTEVRPAGRIYKILQGTEIVDRGATMYASHPGLTEVTGEEILVDKSDPNGRKLASPQFELRVKLSQNDNEYIQTPGQKAYVRFRLGNQPLIEQWGRRFWQLIQRENRTASWM